MVKGTLQIGLVPVGPVSSELLNWLKVRLHDIFHCSVNLMPELTIPVDAYDSQRKQYLSTKILQQLQHQTPIGSWVLLGITEEDIFAKGLNFVFGEAYVGGHAALISLHRLYPEYDRFPPNPDRLRERVLKEAIHEIGHTLGLVHCPESDCIMYYSNTIEDTDRKGPGFCLDCQGLLIRRI